MRTLSAGLLAFCAILVLVPCADGDDDFIVLPQVTYAAAGQPVDMPVYVRDMSGSPVGLDVGKSIRYLQFTVKFDHPEFISGCTNQTFPACEVKFRTDGVLAGFTHAGNPITFVDGQSIFIRRISAKTVDWTLDAAAPGDLIGYLTITMDPAVSAGNELELTFDPDSDATKLGDQTLTVSETFGHGLRLAKGQITVVDCSLPPDPAKLDFDWLGALTGCTTSSGGCRSGETVVFNARSSASAFGACETVSWQFGDGSALKTGKSIVHEYAAGSYDVTMTVSTTGGVATVKRSITISDPCVLPPIERVGFRYEGSTSRCTFPTDCGIDESIHFTVIGDDAIAACSTTTWTFGDGTPSASGNEVDHTYAAAGVYPVVLHVTTAGVAMARSQLVKVKQQIVCTATLPAAPALNTPLLFHATSDIPDSSFYWAFDDSFATTADTEKIYTKSGTKDWALIVTHDALASCVKRGTFVIDSPPRRRGAGH